jgi:hypothetical protein
MKNIFIIFLIIFGFYHLTDDKSVSIPYYYDGPFLIEIQKGLDSWGSTRMEFFRANDINSAFLYIYHVDAKHIKNSRWVAQYVPRTRTIMLNNDYDRILKGDYLSSVITHESGHFLGLDHNDESNSIMNYKIKHNSRTPSFLDKQRANDKITTVYYRKILNDFLYKNDKYTHIGSSYR